MGGISKFYLFSNRISRSMPKVIIPTCQNEDRKKSGKYKSSYAWNELPKSWYFHDTILPTFKKQIQTTWSANGKQAIFVKF